MKHTYAIILFFFLFAGTAAAKETRMYAHDPELVKLVQFYPNPAISNIIFEFAAEVDKTYTLHIYSFMGRKMSEQPVTASRINIPLDGYYRGLYVFQLRDKTGQIVESGKFQVVR